MMRIRLSRNGQTNSNGSFDWIDAFVDSIIFASGFGIGSLITGIADGGLSTLDMQIAVLLFASSFIAFLSKKRGIPKTVDEGKQ